MTGGFYISLVDHLVEIAKDKNKYDAFTIRTILNALSKWPIPSTYAPLINKLIDQICMCKFGSLNTLSCMWAQEGVPPWITGLIAVGILLAVVLGGVDRIGYFASRVVPIKFLLYVVFALLILSTNAS